MPLHHFLPASYLASFSDDKTTLPRRSRVIAVGDKVSGRLFSTRASKVGAVKNLYAPAGKATGTWDVDEVWSRYERGLPRAVARLIKGNLDATTWARVLIPFVTCMLVRGPDFERRFVRRLQALGLPPALTSISADSSNEARLLDVQRLLGPVTAAKWAVIEVSGGLITNDLGYAPFQNNRTGEFGLAIPLAPSYVLAIVPRERGTIATFSNGRWIPMIERVAEPPSGQLSLNEALAQMAQRFIYGSTEDLLATHLALGDSSWVPPDPGVFGFLTSRSARAHEFTWHRFVAALEKHPADLRSAQFPLDWEVISKGWHPPVFFPTNLPEFPPALRCVDQRIEVEFYDPEVYYALNAVWELGQIGRFDILVEEATKGIAAAREDKERVQLLVSRAAGLNELGRRDEAIVDCDDALRRDPSSAEGHAVRGVALAGLNRLAEAVDCFTQALDLSPDLPLTRLNRGNANALLDEQDAALEDLSIATASLPDGPQRAAAFESRGNLFIQRRSHEQALEDLGQAIALHVEPDARGRCYFRRGVAHLLNGELEATLSDAVMAIEEAPHSDSYLLRAEAESKLGMVQGSISSLGLALDAAVDDESRTTALWRRGIQLAEAGEIAEGMADFNRALALSGNLEIQADMGLAYLVNGDLTEAAQHLDWALAANPQNARALNSRGLVYALQGKHSEAIGCFDKAIRELGRDVEAASPGRNKAVTLAAEGQLDSADQALRQAMDIASDAELTLLASGLVECYRGRYTEALSLISSAQKDGSGDTQFLSLPLFCLRRREEALALVQEYARSEPVPLGREQLLMHMRNLSRRLPDVDGFEDAMVTLRRVGRGNSPVPPGHENCDQ